jgi:transcriptional regulator PpsR
LLSDPGTRSIDSEASGVTRVEDDTSTPFGGLFVGSSTGSLERVIEAASDMALMVDSGGVVREVYLGATFPQESGQEWIGRPWSTTVTRENREKISELLAEAGTGGVSRFRQVTQAFASGREVPVGFTAVRVGKGGEVVAIGRDLQTLSALQQRLVEAQQAMERDYWKLRQIETRYRLLFQRSAEAVVVVDSVTLKTVDANPAAGAALGLPARETVGREFHSLLDPSDREVVEAHLTAVRTRGRAEEVRVRAGPRRETWRLSASLVRQDPSSLFLIHLRAPEASGVAVVPETASASLTLLRDAPDGFVVLNPDGSILSANRAFLDLAQLTAEEEVRGESISRWLGRPGADLTVLLTTLRTHGVVRLFSTSVRGEYGSVTEVELSAVAAVEAEVPAVGIVVRDVGRRLARGPEGAAELSRAVEQLTGLVGRVGLRKLVGDTVALVERHFVEAALELTGDNRTAAAELLGLSRQSLYTKLRRYNLSHVTSGGDEGFEGDRTDG